MNKKVTLALKEDAGKFSLVIGDTTTPPFECKSLMLNAIVDLAKEQVVTRKNIFAVYGEIVNLSEEQLPLLEKGIPESKIEEFTKRSNEVMELTRQVYRQYALIDDCPPESYYSFTCAACEKIHGFIIDKNGIDHKFDSKEEGCRVLDYLETADMLSSESATRIKESIAAETDLQEDDESGIMMVEIGIAFFGQN